MLHWPVASASARSMSYRGVARAAVEQCIEDGRLMAIMANGPEHRRPPERYARFAKKAFRSSSQPSAIVEGVTVLSPINEHMFAILYTLQG